MIDHGHARYIQGVTDGSIVTGGFVRAAVARHVDDLLCGHTRGLRFCPQSGQHAVDFFGFLQHSKGEWAGKRFILSDWQQFLVYVLFGWLKTDGLRRFRVAYNEIARKNGKSTLAAGIGLYLFAADSEPGAEVYTAATKRDQARITHLEATRMVRSSPALNSRFKIFKDNINLPATASKFEPLGADADSMDGLNVHAAIIDELHAHKTPDVWAVLDTATGARRQPMIFAITTAGFDRHSVCWSQREYAIKILEKVIVDDSFFAFIAGIDEGDDWTEESVWEKANPNLGVSVNIEDLRRKVFKARNLPAEQNAIRRLHLNEWTEQSDRWIDLATWDACQSEFDLDSLVGAPCYLGLDLATVGDIAAASLLFTPHGYRKTYAVLPIFWVPGDNIPARAKKDRVPYDRWAKDGILTATPGNVIDYDCIRRDINALREKYDIREVVIDRWNATQITTQLMGDGFTVVPFGMGYVSMSAPTRALETLILGKTITHDGNAVLRWMVSNVAVTQDPAGNMKPDKGKSSEKIDGVVALIMALGRASLAPDTHSVYESRGLLIF